MSIFDFEQKPDKPKAVTQSEEKPELKIHMPGANEESYTIVGPSQINRIYEDGVGARLVIIADEIAELLQPTGTKNEAGKQEDALKQEISMIIQSITQLGRSAGVHCVLCTQRNDANLISGIIQNNSLFIDTKVLVKRKVTDTNQ